MMNPSAEHCAITLVDGQVRKYLKPAADLTKWQERCRITRENTDIFAETRLVGRVAHQAYLVGETTPERMKYLIDECRRRELRVYDVQPKNVVAGMIVDFAVLSPSRRRRGRA